MADEEKDYHTALILSEVSDLRVAFGNHRGEVNSKLDSLFSAMMEQNAGLATSSARIDALGRRVLNLELGGALALFSSFLLALAFFVLG